MVVSAVPPGEEPTVLLKIFRLWGEGGNRQGHVGIKGAGYFRNVLHYFEFFWWVGNDQQDLRQNS